MKRSEGFGEALRKYSWALLIGLGVCYFVVDIRIVKYAIVGVFAGVVVLAPRQKAKKEGGGKRWSKKGRRKGGKEAEIKPVTGWRLWVFRGVAAIVIPALTFLVVEVGLRVGRYGYPAESIVKVDINGAEYYGDNSKFSWRFFPRHVAREMDPFVFPAEKSENSYRVFVLGASAAMGVPNTACSLGRVLEVMLREEYPGVNFEVVTAAMAAINSHVVLEMAKDCARHEPDLFVVYLGNNEVVGPYGAGTVFAPLRGRLSWIRAGIWAKGTRLGQVVTNVLGTVGLVSRGPDVWSVLEMYVDRQVRRGDASLQTVYSHFQSNLEDIVVAGLKGGAKVIVCTVGSNLKDHAPLGSLHRADLTAAEKGKWEEIYEKGVGHESSGEYGEAVADYLAAGKIDDRYADLQFRLGRCYWAMGEYDRAGDVFLFAREQDTLRVRADATINGVIRSVAKDMSGRGVYLVDSVVVFMQNSPHGIAGGELFYEHVHLNFKGAHLLARAIFEQVAEILPEKIRVHKAGEGVVLTEGECARRLAYSDWGRYKAAKEIFDTFINRAPFTNQVYYESTARRARQEIANLREVLTQENLSRAAGLFRAAIEKDTGDWHLRYKYGQMLGEGLNDMEGAAEQFRLVQERYPHSYTACNALGDVLREQGDFEGAVEQYLKVVRIHPGHAAAHYYLGWSYLKLGQTGKAVEYYAKTIRVQPGAVRAYNDLGLILLKLGRVDEAVKVYRNGLEAAPDNAALRRYLGMILYDQGQKDEAIKEIREALRIDPDSVKTRELLERMMKQGD